MTGVDTKQVSVGQAAVVIETAGLLEQKPDISIEELAEAAKSTSGKIQMCFVPETLEYLKAGGRVSNAGAMIGNLLSIHPCIRIENGKLLAREKYRGGMKKIAAKVIRTHAERYPLKKDKLYLLCSPGLSKDIKDIAEREAKSCGFQKINWMQTGCVITSHAGPGCFGVVGMEI